MPSVATLANVAGSTGVSALATSGTFGVTLDLPTATDTVPSGLRCQLRFLELD